MLTELEKTLLSHFQTFRDALKTYGLSAQLDCNTFEAKIMMEETISFFPQFIRWNNGCLEYLSEFSLDAEYFNGWRPYRPVSAFTFNNQLTWRKNLRKLGFSVLDYSFDPWRTLESSVVRNRVCSSSATIIESLKRTTNYNLKLDTGEPFEAPVYGIPLKIWFWLDKPVCVQRQKMSEYKNGFSKSNAIIEFLLSEHDFDLQFIVDKLGTALWSMMKETVPSSCLVYTVDAVWAENDDLWIMDTNTCPFVHPWLYPEMINWFSSQGTFVRKTDYQ